MDVGGEVCLRRWVEGGAAGSRWSGRIHWSWWGGEVGVGMIGRIERSGVISSGLPSLIEIGSRRWERADDVAFEVKRTNLVHCVTTLHGTGMQFAGGLPLRIKEGPPRLGSH